MKFRLLKRTVGRVNKADKKEFELLIEKMLNLAEAYEKLLEKTYDLKSQNQTLQNKLNDVVEIQNPYPESVWPEINYKEWELIDRLFQEHLDFRLDRVSASLMRRAWELYRGEVKRILDQPESED